MKLKLNLACSLLLACTFSCAEDQPTPPASEGVLSTPVGQKSTVGSGSGAAAVPPTSLVDAPPRDARYTIYCLGVTGPDHTDRANQIKLLWRQATQRRDWYVVHQDDQSLVYFGYYRSISDSRDPDTARAIADRKMIQNLKDSVGDQPFSQALLLPLDAPDPTAPPQWNLANAKGAWSLEIAAYKGPDRKAYAVDAVREARKQGVEAYYFHGPSASSVCIGAWPEAAVTQEMHGNIQNTDPSQAVVVVPDSLAARMPDVMTDSDGSQSKVVHNGAQIADPTLLAAMQKYPIHSVNGEVDFIMVNNKRQPRQTAVVAIPHSEGESPDASPMATQRPNVDLLGGDNSGGDSTSGDSSRGRLRSLGQ